jgi:hypothetical protein
LIEWLALLGSLGNAGLAVAQSPSSPEAVLASRGLQKSGRFYLIATEAEVFNELAKIAPVCARMEAARDDLIRVEQFEASVWNLQAERIAVRRRLQELETQIPAISANNTVDSFLRR